MLSGAALVLALARTQDTHIKLLSPTGLDRKVPIAEAMQLVTAIDGAYEGRSSKRRVRYIRHLGCRPKADTRQFPVDAAHWDGRGCIRHWAEQGSAKSGVRQIAA